MSFLINTTPVLSATVGTIWLYTVSAIETHPLATGTSAVHHFSISAVRGPTAFSSNFIYVSGTDASMYIRWAPKVSDVIVSGGESVALTITAFSTSGIYVNQELSISAATSSSYNRRTNIGDGSSNGFSDIADFQMRGLGTKG